MNNNKNCINEQKQVAYYQVMVNSWVFSAMELDRSLLVLSAAGVGLLTALASTMDSISYAGVGAILLSLCFFIVCIACVLLIFHTNKILIEKQIQQGPDEQSLLDKSLECLDLFARVSFILAIIFGALFGITVIYN